MKKKVNLLVLLISFLVISQIPSFSQVPEWTSLQNRNFKFPQESYLTGYSENKNTQNMDQVEFLNRLKSYAQTELIQSVQLRIESASAMSTLETNGNFSELFKMSSVSTSGMTINGINFETYYDKRSKMGYVMALAKRKNVLESYLGQVKQIKSSIEQKLELAKKIEGQQTKQLKELHNCFPEFRNAEEAQSIIYALNPNINESDLLLNEFKSLKIDVENFKATLEKSSATNITEAASMIALAIKNQIPDTIKSSRLLNLSYEDSKMGSTFSRRFSSTLEQKLSTETNLAIITDVTAAEQTSNNIITGTYWQEGDAIRIILVLKNTTNNQTLASAETKLEKAWLKANNINFEPENFKEAYANARRFKTDEISGGGLIAEIWSNKGDENLIYTKGELLKLFVRVNKECYIRVIYHLADGSRVLLIDNYYIGSDKVNMVYEIPEEFECSDPFGVETLQLNAQTVVFDPLHITKEYGYDFITESLDAILINTRGFKKKTDKVLKAERRMIITTMND